MTIFHFIIAALVVLVAGVLVLVMPSLRRRSMLLRGAKDLPGLRLVRPMIEFDLATLAWHLPLLAGLGRAERQTLLAQARIHNLPADAVIVRVGEPSSDAFFLISGRAIAGIEADGSYHTLEVLNAGDLLLARISPGSSSLACGSMSNRF